VRGGDSTAASVYLQDWLGTLDELKSEPIDLIEAGDDKVIANRMRLRGPLSIRDIPPGRAHAASLLDQTRARSRALVVRRLVRLDTISGGSGQKRACKSILKG
jgi:hypothetical protein